MNDKSATNTPTVTRPSAALQPHASHQDRAELPVGSESASQDRSGCTISLDPDSVVLSHSGCASIARIDFRQYFGYRLIYAALWFTMGVIAFTFLPC